MGKIQLRIVALEDLISLTAAAAMEGSLPPLRNRRFDLLGIR